MSLLCFSVLHNFTRGTFSDVFFYIYTFMIFRKIWMGVYFMFCVNWTWFRLIYRLCSPTALFTQIQSHQDHKFFRRTVHTSKNPPVEYLHLLFSSSSRASAVSHDFKKTDLGYVKEQQIEAWQTDTNPPIERERERETQRDVNNQVCLFFASEYSVQLYWFVFNYSVSQYLYFYY